MSLRDALEKDGLIIAPGVYDALSGLIASQSGAQALYLSGASLAYTRFGTSDIGLISVSEVNDTIAAITDRINIPIIVDADTGFGNALNVQRTVRSFERSGAHAIQLEDQSFPKKCGHLDGKKLVSTQEMVGKIQAALDARASEETLSLRARMRARLRGLPKRLSEPGPIKRRGPISYLSKPPNRFKKCSIYAQNFQLRSPFWPIWSKVVKHRFLPPVNWQSSVIK